MRDIMENIIKNIYFGCYSETDIIYRSIKGGEKERASGKALDTLSEALNDEQKALLDKYCDAYGCYAAEETMYTYIRGFKVGAKLMLEILGK